MDRRYRELADTLDVWLEQKPHLVNLHYQIDQEFSGNIEIKTSFALEQIEQQLFYLLGTLGAVFIAQLCLARQVNINIPTSQLLISALEPTTRTLYAVRAYRDGIKTLPKVTFNVPHTHEFHNEEPLISNKRAVLLWSGGLDSTVSLALLKINGYEIMPIHASHGNVDAADSEFNAVKRLSRQLGISFETVDIYFPQYLDIAGRYSPNAREYPRINSVPHGRELILLPAALIYASTIQATNICFGFENSTWTEQFDYDGQRYSRFDTQSEFCNVNLQNIIRMFVSQNVSLFSPIAPITEYRKFLTLVTHFPDLAKNASFCYWGKSCGVCRKCVLYYLFQRSLGIEVIPFERNPIIERSPIIVESIQNWANLNYQESNFALAQIVANGYSKDGEDILDEYKEKTFPLVEPFLDKWRADLLATHSVALIPTGFEMNF